MNAKKDLGPVPAIFPMPVPVVGAQAAAKGGAQ